MYFQGFDPWYDHVYVKCLVFVDYIHTIPSVPFWKILLHNYDIIRFNHATTIYRYVYKLLRSVCWNLNHLNSNFCMTYGASQDRTINMKMVLNIYIQYLSEIKRISLKYSKRCYLYFFARSACISLKQMHIRAWYELLDKLQKVV